MDRLKLLFPYLLLGAVVAVVVATNLPGDRSAGLSASASGRWIDVVCRMEVNTSWGIEAAYQGTTYHFCNERCRERFLAQPQRFVQRRCVVCDEAVASDHQFTATYLGNSYELCSADHRAMFKRDPAAFFMHSMWGIPTWMYYASIAAVLVVSFGLFDWLSRGARVVTRARKPARSAARMTREQIHGEGERMVARTMPPGATAMAGAIALPIHPVHAAIAPLGSVAAHAVRGDRFDLLSIAWVRTALYSRMFRFVLQAVVSALFLLVIAAGLFGHQNPALNIAPILTWTIWWGLLIIFIMFAGKGWCYVCPWDAIAGWTERLRFWKKSDDGLSLGWKWPKIVRNILIATVMFVGLTWIELGFGVTMKPRVTAYLAIGMLLMAVVSALLFDRKSFCRYGCLVGRVSGLYALFAGTEVRHKSAAVCKACSGKECVTGSETAYGCPTFLYPGKLSTNTYCIQCMECVQACPHDNMAVNLRPWGSDLVVEGKPRADEAYLALLMLAITGFHGLTMTPVWQQFVDGIRDVGGFGRIVGFSIGMGVLMLAPIAIYAALVGVSVKVGRVHATRPLTYRDYFIRYAYALLPIALFYHIAHNLEHLLMEGPKVVAMISDPFGWGWNVLGTASWTVPPMISLSRLWVLQVFLVLVGHVYSLWIAQKTSLRLFGTARGAFRSQLPMLVGMICFSVFSLWLLKQPMEMRTSAM